VKKRPGTRPRTRGSSRSSRGFSLLRRRNVPGLPGTGSWQLVRLVSVSYGEETSRDPVSVGQFLLSASGFSLLRRRNVPGLDRRGGFRW